MSTFNAFYVRKHGADDATKAAIAGFYPKADIQILPEFFGAILSRDEIEPPEQKLKELSASLGTDVIWVTFQTTAESFIFHHWRAGEQLRALWYGCADEGVWGRAEGEAEPWEAEEFWSEEALEGALECAESESEQRKLRRLWKDRVIRKGQTDPSVSSEDTVHAVMEHYGLFDPNQPEMTTSGDKGATPVPPSTGVRVFRALVWVVILFVIGFFIWRLPNENHAVYRTKIALADEGAPTWLNEPGNISNSFLAGFHFRSGNPAPQCHLKRNRFIQ